MTVMHLGSSSIPPIPENALGALSDTALTYGLAGIKFKLIVTGVQADVAIPQSEPEFYFYFAISPQMYYVPRSWHPSDFILATFTTKQQRRELVIDKIGTGRKRGAPEKVVHTFKVEEIAPGTYRVLPSAPLGSR